MITQTIPLEFDIMRLDKYPHRDIVTLTNQGLKITINEISFKNQVFGCNFANYFNLF